VAEGTPSDGWLEWPSCPLCGTEASRLFASREVWAPHRVVCCEACKFVYLSPRPSVAAMRALYERDDYFEGESAESGYRAYAEQERALRLTFRRWLVSLAREGLARGALLEIGCGHGFLLDEAAPFFSRREGTEFSSAAASAAAKRADAIHLGGVEEVPAEARYDLVLSNQVIEHVHAPRDFLARMIDHVKPGGAIAISTPWMRSPWHTVLRSRWPSYKIPEHLLYFDPRSLRALMEGAGLRRVRRFAYPHAFPLSLVAAKLGLALPDAIGRVPLWIPGTTLAMVGVRDDGSPCPDRRRVPARHSYRSASIGLSSEARRAG
jgi:SAM-dependent methyltransferase